MIHSRDLVVTVSTFPSVTVKVPDVHTVPLGDVLGELLIVEDKESAPLWSPALFNHEYQKSANVVSVGALVYDVDQPGARLTDVCQSLAGIAHVVHSTWRHLEDGQRQRYRVVLLVDRPILPSEYRAAWQAARARYVPLADATQHDPSRAHYAPSAPSARAAQAICLWGDGDLIAVDALVPRPAVSIGRAAAAVPPPIADRPGEGSRNRELFRFASSLRRRGDSEAEIYQRVLQRNAKLDAPLDADECTQIARHAAKYDPDPVEAALPDGAPGPLLVGDQVEVAELELTRVTANAELISDRGQGYSYDAQQGTWRAVDRAELRCGVHEYSRRAVQKPGLTAAGNPFAPTLLSISHNFADGAAKIMIDKVARPGYFDSAPPGVTFGDCHVALDGGQVVKMGHDSSNRALHRHPWPFDPAPSTPLWDQFLADLRVGSDVEQFLHEYLGCCLVGDVTRYKVCVVLLGDGNNGKSVLLDVVQACFPKGSIAAVPPREWSKRFALSSLVDASLNVVDEMPAVRLSETSVFKEVVSGGRVRAERKFEGAFEFRPRAGHLFAANELPRALDKTEGFYSRWAVVVLPRSFAAAERDYRLRDRLLAEVPAISSRLVLAAAAVAQRGSLEPPAPLVAAREAWRTECDHALRYALQLERDLSASAETQSLYRGFVRWSEHDERLPKDEIASLRAFALALARAGHERVPHDGRSNRAWRIKCGPFAQLN